MKTTTSLILGALLVAGLSLALACSGTLDLQIDPTPALAVTSTTPARTVTSPAPVQQDVLSASRAALADYDPLQDAAPVVDALSQACARWLSEGGDPATLADALRALPKLSSADVEVTTADLNGDGLSDVVIEPQFLGLSVLACLAGEGELYTCRPLPAPDAFGEFALTMESGVQSPDLIGDGRPETVITYTVQGGSGWTELLYVFRWPEPGASTLVFHAALVNWAGSSSWHAEPDPMSLTRQQIVLTYPHLYDHGFDHKMLNHPLGRQTWRWDGAAGQFVLAAEEADLTRSAWGPGVDVTTEDRFRWLTNEGETAFRMGRYEEASVAFEEALFFAVAQSRGPAQEEPDWIGLLRFRRAQTLAYLGRTAEALSAMEKVASDYKADPLGELAEAFLSGYGDGSGATAAKEAYAAMQAMEERLRDHLYEERPGALRFPMTAEGILCCVPGTSVEGTTDGSRWPRVGIFEPAP